MPTIKTAKQLVSDLRNYMSALYRHLDTSEGSIADDIIISPYSVSGELLLTEAQKIVDLQVLDKISGTDLDAEGGNERAERLPGRKATGKVTYYLSSTTPPSVDLTVPAGAVVSNTPTATGSQFSVVTTQTKTLSVTQAAAFFVTSRSRYELEVAAEASASGTGYNLATGRYNRMTTTVSGFTGVENRSAFTGGEDIEEDDEYRKRIRLRKIGRDIGTKNGLVRFILDKFDRQIDEAEVVLTTDSDVERPTGIDVWAVSAAALLQTTDRFTIVDGQDEYLLTQQPIIIPSSGPIATVVGEGRIVDGGSNVPASGSGHVEGENVEGENGDYNIIPRNGIENLFRRSNKAGATFRITDDSKFNYDSVGVGEIVAVTYSYSPIIGEVQTVLESEDVRLLSANPLIKEAIRTDFTVNARVTFYANVDRVAEREKVTSALTSWFEDLGLNTAVDQSDLLVAIQIGHGDFPIFSVDSVSIELINGFSALSEAGESFSPDVNGRIQLDRKHYPRLLKLTFI